MSATVSQPPPQGVTKVERLLGEIVADLRALRRQTDDQDRRLDEIEKLVMQAIGAWKTALFLGGVGVTAIGGLWAVATAKHWFGL